MTIGMSMMTWDEYDDYWDEYDDYWGEYDDLG